MFTEQYGITVETLRASSGDLVTRFATEHEAGVIEADLLDVADPSLFSNQPDWFVALSPEMVPGLEDYPKVEDPDADRGWQETDVMLRTNLATAQYNTELVPFEIDSWLDITDNADFFRGQCLLSDPRTSPSYMGWAELMRRHHGIEYLHTVRDMDCDLIDSASPGGQQVAAGAYLINFAAATTHSLDLMAEGAPITGVQLPDPAYGPEHRIGIVDGGRNPNAARLFVHHMIQPETHSLICEMTGSASVIGDRVDECLELPEGIDRIPYEIWGDQAIESELLEALGIQ